MLKEERETLGEREAITRQSKQTYLHGKMNRNNDERRSGNMHMVWMNDPKVS